MKKKFLLGLACLLLASVQMNVKAQVKPYDFTDGKLFYKITSKEAKEVYVVSEKPRGVYTVKLKRRAYDTRISHSRGNCVCRYGNWEASFLYVRGSDSRNFAKYTESY